MSSSSGSSSSPAPTRKRKPDVVESYESGSSDSDDRDASDANSTDEEGSQSDALRKPPLSMQSAVLSHAERRRQKKKEKRAQLVAASESQSAHKKRKLGDGTASAVCPGAKGVGAKSTAKALPTEDDRRRKRQNSVWVGNLSFRTTEEGLRGFFDGVGTITRIHMPMRRGKQSPGENMGFAYVDFEAPDAKVIAITLSENHLDGRNLLIKDGDDFTGRPVKAKTNPGDQHGEQLVKSATTGDGKDLSKTSQKILRVQKQPPAPTLFLGNLGFETTEESIRELFEAHRYWRHKNNAKGVEDKGKQQDDASIAKLKDAWIRKVRMGTFEDSGACKGFAFIDFTSIDHATDALINPRNHRLNGRDLVVEYASADAVRRGGGGPRHQKGDWTGKSRDGNGNGRTPQKGPANITYTKQPGPPQVGSADNVDIGEAPMDATAPLSGPRRTGNARRDRSHTRRAKPGAALAQAQRQSAAIVPGQGQKIVF